MEEKITNAVLEFLKEHDGFLVEIKVNKGKKVNVFIDQMHQNINIKLCVALTKKLRREEIVDEDTKLEVSSPGMENPFKVYKQFLKNIGRNITVVMNDGLKLEGILAKVEEKEFLLEQHLKRKGRVPEITQHHIQFDETKSVKKKISF